MRQIMINAGVEGSVIVNSIKKSDKKNYGYDAYNEKYCDMIEMGIVDPAKVTRCALQNAASVADIKCDGKSHIKWCYYCRGIKNS